MSNQEGRENKELPKGWSWAPFKAVATIASNLVPPQDWPTLPHIAPDNIARDTGVLLPYRTAAEDKVISAKHLFKPGQLLYSKIRPYLNKCVRVDFAGLCSADMYPIDAHIDSSYLHSYILSRQFVSAVTRASGSRTVLPKTNQAQLSDIPIPVAPAGEQRRIAEAIDSYVSRLDDSVATLTRVERNLKRYRASVLKSAVEGRLVPTEAELAKQEGRDYEPASVLLERVLAERRRRWSESGKKGKYQEPSPPDTSKLPPLPEGWCWATVDQLAAHEPRSLCDGPFGSNLKSSHYTDVGPRVVRLQNIGDGIFRDESAHISEEHFHLLKKHAVYAGDLVVASLGDVLPRAAMIPEWLGQAVVKADCLRFSVHSEMALSTYVMHALNSVSVRKRTEELVHGVGRPRIGLGLLREVAVPVPPRQEQNRIVAEVGRLLSVIDSCMAGVARELLRCQHLRQSILKWAFEGKLVDQDPDDQRATVLMERTKIEPHATSNRLGAAEISRRMSSRHLVEDENAIDVVGASSLVHSRGGAR